MYFLSSFTSVTLPRYRPPDVGEWAKKFNKQDYVVMSRPRILRGDEMHYLIMANSLGRDGDLRISWDYANVLRGGLDMGYWHRFYPVRDPNQHFTRMNDPAHAQFSLVNRHPIGLSLVLAMLLWPLAGTACMEAGCIWVTVLASVACTHFLLRILEGRVSWRYARNTALLVAFASPQWSYARTLFTETYMMLGFLVVLYLALRARAVRGLPLYSVLAWFKYPALLMFFSSGVCELLQKRWRNFFIMGAVGGCVLLAITLFNRWFFARTGFMIFNADWKPYSRSGISAPITWWPGKLGSNLARIVWDWDKGLFPYTPVLFFGLVGLVQMWWRDREFCKLVLACALPWFALHVSYRFVMTGDCYTVRYLVPVVPFVLMGVPFFLMWTRSRWWRVPFWFFLGWSLVLNTIAGVLPALAFSRTPAQMLASVAQIIKALVHT
jgi:hypothetical protein